MGNVRFELNHDGVRAILQSPEVQADLARRASAIAAAAGSSGGTFGHDTTVGRARAHGSVWTEDVEAIIAEARHRVLTRALDAGR